MTDGVSEERGVAPGAVVVGVDGSQASRRALRWAARQAGLTGSTLEVVTAWTFPEHAAPLGVVPRVPWPEELLAQARKALDRLLDEVLPDRDKDRVHARVVRGNAAPVLVDAARNADLLVVGTRGRGEFAELVLGSVSERCVRHAGCPVVIVR
jgi:nucleotide-binding universal stress UspA family protein